MGNTTNNSLQNISDELENPLFENIPNIQQEPIGEVENLTTSPENRRIIQQILNSNQDMLEYYGNIAIYYQGIGGNNMMHRKIKLKKSRINKPDLFLDRHSLTLEKSKKENNLYYLHFKFANPTSDVMITIMNFCMESVDEDSGITKNVKSVQNSKNSPVTKFKFPKSEEIKSFPKELAYISLEKIDLEAPKPNDESHHTIILLEAVNEKKFRLYTYLNYRLGLNDEVKIAQAFQKLERDNQSFILQEIFGQDNETSHGGKECSICLVDKTTVMVFPCKHMCLCDECAKDLRSRTSRCPICRKKIRFFLKVSNCDSSIV